jgi:hypothetical protein
MMWSIQPLAANGFGIADRHGTTLDNGLFEFTPETLEHTFKSILLISMWQVYQYFILRQ